MPGVSTPSFPFGGAILTGLRIQFPLILLLGLFACYLMPRAGWHKVRHHAASSPLLQIHSRFMRGFVGSLLWENRVATRFLQATRLSKRPSLQGSCSELTKFLRPGLFAVVFSCQFEDLAFTASVTFSLAFVFRGHPEEIAITPASFPRFRFSVVILRSAATKDLSLFRPKPPLVQKPLFLKFFGEETLIRCDACYCTHTVLMSVNSRIP
jgi:hypothetical protein